MKRTLILVGLVFLGGCSVVAPSISKAQTEEKQLKVLQEQNKALNRIADAIENLYFLQGEKQEARIG